MRSLEATGKRHIFLTGQRGTGKSTLFVRLQAALCAPALTSFAKKGEGVWMQTGTRLCQVGQYDEALPGTENKMRPLEVGFDTAAQWLRELARGQEEWAAVDEIGYLEPEAYQEELTRLLEQKRVLAVVRKQDTPFLTALLARSDALVVDLDGADCGCVLMASGLGRRFGGNKLMASLGGKPVVAWGMDAAKEVFSETVVVTRHEDVAKLAEEKGLSARYHDLPHRSDTVRLGLERMDLPHCLFLAGDQPFVMKESLYAMVLCAKNAPEAIWRLGHGAPVLFPAWAYEALRTLPQGKGGGVLLQKYPHRVQSLPEVSCWELRDIDTPQDLSCFCAGICCN